jgi:uncharacterized protein YodC (DUF2158 family)
VQVKNGDGRPMYIKHFVRQSTGSDVTAVYTKELICYWFEEGIVRKETFHEDELELARQEQLFSYPSYL